MLFNISLIIGLILILTPVFFLVFNYFKYKKGEIQLEESRQGVNDFIKIFYAIIRLIIKKYNQTVKIIYDHILHFAVILSGILANLSDGLYARMRDYFVSEAINNKSTVKRFWKYLKVYKSEIDSEKK